MSIFNHFQHIDLTNDQNNALVKISNFLTSEEKVFILQGYAGTGKTTILKGVCDYLIARKNNFKLMSPTGRAAMVLQEKTKSNASTIHKSIYNLEDITEELNGDSFRFIFNLNGNKDSVDTTYIVDEASMISDVYSEGEFFTFGSGRLLRDLMEFVFAGQGKQKLIFIGDTAQLPPVGMNSSPALCKQYLSEKYNISSNTFEIKEVVRQAQSSGILSTSIQIRESIEKNNFNAFSIDYSKKDIIKTNIDEFIDKYVECAKRDSLENTIIISHSNNQALEFNKIVRKKRYNTSNELIQTKDRLIITKNNYNGEIVLLNGMFTEVLSVGEVVYNVTSRFNIKDKGIYTANLNLREVVIQVYSLLGRYQQIKTAIIENLLSSKEGALHPYDQRALYIDFKTRMEKKGIKPKTTEFKQQIKTDLYFNAIQAKFGYAITCHKSQGGEWKNVFVDFKVFIGKNTLPYYKWAYTAITRSNNQLYCIDAPEYNALSEFIVKDVLKITKISPQMYYMPNESFVEWRIGRLTNICESQHIIFTHKIFNNQIHCEFSQNANVSNAKFWYSNSGFTSTIWEYSKEADFNVLVENIAKESLLSVEIPFDPKFDFQKDLHQYLLEILSENDVFITNIEQKEWSDIYYISTDADCASIEFHFNAKHFYTYVQPKSTLGLNDKKLCLIVTKLKGE